MKVIYLSNLPFTDCDFPLIREMQIKGIDVYYFLMISPHSYRCALLDIKQLYSKSGIFKAVDVYPEFKMYKDYFNLDNVFVINYTMNSGTSIDNIRLTFNMVRTFKKLQPDVINITWPICGNQILLYLLRKKLVLTLHDPFPHSGKARARIFEFWRKISFLMINRIIILNKTQVPLFSKKYNYPIKQIFTSKLGVYDGIKCFSPEPIWSEKKYILFFGLISKYKGVEYLLEAYRLIQNRHKDVELIIAGKGPLYFDKSLYEGNSNIIILNEYITMPRLAGLLKNALFTVCPYKDATQSGVVQTAFSMNCPVIVTDVGGLPEAVDEHITGLIVPSCNSEALANAMDKLLSDRTLLDSMRLNIKSIWSKQMGWGTILEEYLRCYSS